MEYCVNNNLSLGCVINHIVILFSFFIENAILGPRNYFYSQKNMVRQLATL